MSNYILTEELLNTFHSNYEIDSDTGCWVWKGTVNGEGHPYIAVRNKNTLIYNAFASRIAFQLKTKNVTNENFRLERICGNKLCVNPEHIHKMQNKKLLGNRQSPNKCKIEGCEKPRRHRDTEMCDPHHRRFIQFGDAEATPLRVKDTGTLKERFHKKYKINEDTGCWLWQGSCQGDGYGNIQNGKQNLLAHRVSYEFYFPGVLKPEDKIMHKCDIRTCVNPDHLLIGTDQDNSDDKIKKGRHRISSIKDLTVKEILDIRNNTNLSKEDLAFKYKITIDLVGSIRNREIAAHLNDEGAFIQEPIWDKEISEIRAFLIKNSTLNSVELAKMFHISSINIRNIKNGKTWIEVPLSENYLNKFSDEELRKTLDILSDSEFEKLLDSLKFGENIELNKTTQPI